MGLVGEARKRDFLGEQGGVWRRECAQTNEANEKWLMDKKAAQGNKQVHRNYPLDAPPIWMNSQMSGQFRKGRCCLFMFTFQQYLVPHLPFYPSQLTWCRRGSAATSPSTVMATGRLTTRCSTWTQNRASLRWGSGTCYVRLSLSVHRRWAASVSGWTISRSCLASAVLTGRVWGLLRSFVALHLVPCLHVLHIGSSKWIRWCSARVQLSVAVDFLSDIIVTWYFLMFFL